MRGPGEDHTRTLVLASAGTGLVLLAFANVVVTVVPTIAALGGGANDETWALSGMSLGLATMLLSLGAIADDYGRRRVFVLSSLALALSSLLAALAPGRRTVRRRQDPAGRCGCGSGGLKPRLDRPRVSRRCGAHARDRGVGRRRRRGYRPGPAGRRCADARRQLANRVLAPGRGRCAAGARGATAAGNARRVLAPHRRTRDGAVRVGDGDARGGSDAGTRGVGPRVNDRAAGGEPGAADRDSSPWSGVGASR